MHDDAGDWPAQPARYSPGEVGTPRTRSTGWCRALLSARGGESCAAALALVDSLIYAQGAAGLYL